LSEVSWPFDAAIGGYSKIEMPSIFGSFRQLLDWVYRLLGWRAMDRAGSLHTRHKTPSIEPHDAANENIADRDNDDRKSG
jgi:hypothetical protein